MRYLPRLKGAGERALLRSAGGGACDIVSVRGAPAGGEAPAVPLLLGHSCCTCDALVFAEVAPYQRRAVLLRKLLLCAVTFDFVGMTFVDEKEMKRQTLMELVDYCDTVKCVRVAAGTAAAAPLLFGSPTRLCTCLHVTARAGARSTMRPCLWM